MILRLTTLHENGPVGAKPSVFNKSSGYFHGSEESRSGLRRIGSMGRTRGNAEEGIRARFRAAHGMTALRDFLESTRQNRLNREFGPARADKRREE